MGTTTEDLARTVAGLVDAGFRASLERDDKHRENALVYQRLRWRLSRGDDIQIELEALEYPDGRVVFYLQLCNYRGLRSPSFPLDSWKLWADRIEFKYYTHPDTGQGLTFVLDLES